MNQTRISAVWSIISGYSYFLPKFERNDTGARHNCDKTMCLVSPLTLGNARFSEQGQGEIASDHTRGRAQDAFTLLRRTCGQRPL